ncbi:MAG: hypothetical protein ACRCSU_01750 [Paracoccaceae bacterium]
MNQKITPAREPGTFLQVAVSPENTTALPSLPQIVLTCCYDLVDLGGWHPLPEAFRDRPANVRLVELDAHINDPVFCEAALTQVDEWIAIGVLPKA